MAKPDTKGKSGKGKSKGRGKGGDRAPGPLMHLTLDQKLDIIGLLLVGVAAVTVLSFLSSSQGELTGQWLRFLRTSFGFGVFIIPLVLGAAGLWLLLRSFERTPRPKPIRIVGFLVAFAVALASLSWFDVALGRREGWGGTVGDWFSRLIASGVGDVGGVIVLVVWWLLALVFLFDISPSEIAAWFARTFRSVRSEASHGYVINQHMKNGSARPAAPKVIGGAGDAVSIAPARPIEPAPLLRPSVTRVTLAEPATQATPFSKSEQAGAAESDEPTGPIFPRYIGGGQVWQVPGVNDVFQSGVESAMSEDDIRSKVNVIEETLHAFGVEGKVIEVNRGPAITQFGVEPGFIKRGDKATKVKVSKISALADDLALALAAKSIRIEAPVPGRSIVGIEVPNGETSIVALRDVIESEAFQKITSPLRFALGQDVAGQAIAADLAMMPHLLIAGTTGSGKSVCVNTIICCLLCYNTPDDLKLIMVDPKRVELTLYNGIPHLLAPVVVDLERVIGVLKWVTGEMDSRYKRFSKAGARNIADFNARVAKDGGEERMPYIVLVIDELADLMMMAPDETEKMICRLAQMARATGIHLIISTQRPSVDVVTGLIKANFPARISFAVASGTDSRVILDTAGAERLLGRGDMLFISPDAGVPQRVQGCFVSDAEVHNIVRYWKGVRGVETTLAERLPAITDPLPAHQPPLWDDVVAADTSGETASEDDLLERAIDVVRLQRRASISLLQRRLRIGYTRAARLIDMMEEKGIVSPAEEGSRWREVLIDAPR